MTNRQPTVFIIGGGLAGMTVAKELAKRRVPVVILEKAGRLGGKAGADPVSVVFPDGRSEIALVDHGYHVFPAWYVNVRALLRELHIDTHLIDIDVFHHLHRPTSGDSERDRLGRLYSYGGVSSLREALRGLFSGEQPRAQSIAAAYFFLDLMAERFSYADYLDAVSVIGLLRSRFYSSEAVAKFHNESVLQASSIPASDLSAMTLQNVAKSFLTKPEPFYSILDGDLQSRFIDPFAKQLHDLGVTVRFKCDVQALTLEGQRIAGLRATVNGAAQQIGSTQDIFVLTTPPEVTARFVDGPVYAAEHAVLPTLSAAALAAVKPLSGLHHLVSEPMAAFHIWVQPRLTNIPREPVVLYGSRFRTSFVDISQHWTDLKGRDVTVLSVIASDYKELKNVDQATRVNQVLTELLEYLPQAATRWTQIDERAHINEPLFLNTVNAWTYRPQTCTAFANLFIAGDYCQTSADLTTMESAVSSGLATAEAVLRRALNMPTDGMGPQQLQLPSWWRFRIAKYAMLPVILPIGIYNYVQRHRPQRQFWRQLRQRARR